MLSASFCLLQYFSIVVVSAVDIGVMMVGLFCVRCLDFVVFIEL